MDAWMRVLWVKLTSKKFKKSFIYGANENIEYGEDLGISITGHKYMSALQDSFTVKINNLTYSEITQLVMGQFYDIEIFAGYKNANVSRIFKGGVLYISNQLNSDKTNTAIIICTSEMVAKYGQSRINLTLNSGINLYSAIKFVCDKAGMPNSNISTQFKKEFLTEVLNVNNSPGSWIDKLCKNNNTFITNSDSILDQTFSIFDAARSNSRIIKLRESDISLINGPPQLNSEGLTLWLLPTFNFMCGDTIEIDNSIIDISIGSREGITENKAAYLSPTGRYMIYEMEYTLQNRGSRFELKLSCKNRDRIAQIVGAK